MYALERGIEAAFQLEDSELDSELLPPDDGPRDRILFTESAEGGAGVLRRLQAERDALAEAAREALRIAHFDPDTGADLGGVRDGQGTQPCGKGCYNCLLSYGNQLVPRADRPAPRPATCCSPSPAARRSPTGPGRVPDRAVHRADRPGRLAPWRQDFVQWLKDNGYRLPDAAQVTVAEALR